jgi:hypothetical protein
MHFFKLVLLVICFSISGYCFGQTATVGLLQENSAEDGYELFAPIRSDTTYLIDKCGRLIHQWGSPNTPGMSVYLLPDGSLLRSANAGNRTFRGFGSQGGQIERYDWNNNLIWSYTLSTDTQMQDHDIYPMPSGNVLAVIWVSLDSNVQKAHGRKPALTLPSIWSVKIQEIQPVGATGGNVIWEWDLRDHLIQDYDSTKANYGVIADHPEMVDINYTDSGTASKDWIHANAVIYNPALDQIIVSAHNLSEIWMVDHSTTSAQAASHTGGAHSRGGDLLYRWGNPRVYGRGTAADRVFYTQHNPNWIPAGYPHAGSIIIFNNGQGRPGGNASSVDIFTPPMDSTGNYATSAGQAYLPARPFWSYEAATPSSFYSTVMGSAQPLANGNIIVCEASEGIFFELDSNKNMLWRYQNPVSANAAVTQGTHIISAGVFRCTQFDASYSGFNGHTLAPLYHIEGNPIMTHCDSVGTNLGLAEISDTYDVSMYPDPAIDHITISAKGGTGMISYQITDLSGRVLIKGESDQRKFEIKLSNIVSGLYLINIASEGRSIQKKIIINQ